MDEARKKTLWVCATILAASKLADLQDGKSAALQSDINAGRDTEGRENHSAD